MLSKLIRKPSVQSEPSISYLVLGGIADQSLRVSERHIARSGSVALVIGNDFNFAMLEHSNARVRCSQINADCWSLCHFLVAQKQSTTINLSQ